MLFRVQSAAVFGIKAYPVAVEVDLSSGEKLALMTVGLPDTAVRVSSERVKAALRNCGYMLPRQHITINLAPADAKKGRVGLRLADGDRDSGGRGMRSHSESGQVTLPGGAFARWFPASGQGDSFHGGDGAG